MNTTIYLRSGVEVVVDELKSVKSSSEDSVYTSDNLDKLYLSGAATYNFIGKTHVVVMGKDIEYIQFD